MIWFVIIVFATLMYIVMDGFDLGIGLLFSTVRGGGDRDVMVNSVAPVWYGMAMKPGWCSAAPACLAPFPSPTR
ncbi:Cytochrome bd2, subunit II [Klebsiella pneumoniae]|uniref:Cytochrome bd2, subunit II n=1 Tax=Klebsiella pneumoniae TaxID=573 RepID=A0A378B345_KLEPN|nr:Cytochrome bd2, subunit II [Klebsiella pneumoniae]